MVHERELTNRIRTLARLVAKESALARVDAYFHNHLATYAPFVSEGVAAAHKPLTNLVERVAQAYGYEVHTHSQLIYLPRYSLWHGMLGSVAGPMAIVFYFDDQHLGLATFGTISEAMTHYIRFSLPEGARDPSSDLGKLQFVGVIPRNQRGTA